MNNKRRQQFRATVFSRDDKTCLVPWCERDADDAHHIIERARWADSGYVTDNGASLCNPHH
jgi:hypothetical protein